MRSHVPILLRDKQARRQGVKRQRLKARESPEWRPDRRGKDTNSEPTNDWLNDPTMLIRHCMNPIPHPGDYIRYINKRRTPDGSEKPNTIGEDRIGFLSDCLKQLKESLGRLRLRTMQFPPRARWPETTPAAILKRIQGRDFNFPWERARIRQP